MNGGSMKLLIAASLAAVLASPASWARTELVLPPVAPAPPVQADADGWVRYVKLSYRGPMLNGVPHGLGECLEPGLRHPVACSFEHGVRADAARMVELQAAFAAREQSRQRYERELQAEVARQRAQQRQQQEAVFAGAMGGVAAAAEQAQAQHMQQRAWEAQMQAQVEAQAQAQAQAQRAQEQQQAALARQQGGQTPGTPSASAVNGGSATAATTTDRPASGAQQGRSGSTQLAQGRAASAQAVASTDDDPSLCVTAPRMVKDDNCPQGAAARIENSCSRSVDARLCLRGQDGAWKCGSRYDLSAGQGWTFGSCHASGQGSPFLSVRYYKSNQALASPE